MSGSIEQISVIVLWGEIDLTGEIRAVSASGKRAAEAKRQGLNCLDASNQIQWAIQRFSPIQSSKKRRSMMGELDGERDFVPDGTFEAGETPEQMKAIQWVNELGEQLAATHPEIADRFRNVDSGERLHDIAAELLPEIFTRNPEAATQAVGNALGRLIPPEERVELTRAHRQRNRRDQFAALSPKEQWEAQSRASKRRHELHGVDVQAMLDARGRTPWSDPEKEWLRQAIQDPTYIRQSGIQSGHPDYKKISAALNEEFHAGREVRYPNSVLSMVNVWRRKPKDSE